MPDHGDSLHPQTKRVPAELLGIHPHPTQNLGMHQSASRDLQPLFPTERFPRDRAVHLKTRLSEREVVGPQPHLRPLPHQLAEKKFQHSLQMGQPDLLPHAQSLHLMKKNPVGRIHLVPPVAAAGGDDLDRRLPLLQNTDLHGGGLRPQEPPPVRTGGQIQIKSVRLIPRRMVRMGVEGVEVVMLRLDLRPVGQGETQPMKDVDDAVERLREDMDGSRGIRFARQGGIHSGGRSCLPRLPRALFRPRLLE